MNYLCKCGCKGKVNLGNKYYIRKFGVPKYIRGHYSKDLNNIEIISPWKGKTRLKKGKIIKCKNCCKEFYSSPKQKKIYCSKQCVSISKKGLKSNCESCGNEIKIYRHLMGKKKYCSIRCSNISKLGKSSYNKGLCHSESHKRNLRLAKSKEKERPWRKTGKVVNCSTCNTSIYIQKNKIGKGNGNYCSINCASKKILSENTKIKMRENGKRNKGRKIPENLKEVYKAAAKKRYHSPEYLKKLRASLNLKPNKKEKIVIRLIEENKLPFKFVGDWKIWIGGKNPDFISLDDSKKIIEVFGEYWHKNKSNIPYNQTEEGTKNIYESYGFKVLIIWESELKNLELVLKKINEFCKENTISYSKNLNEVLAI